MEWSGLGMGKGLNNGTYGRAEGWRLGIGDLGAQMRSEGHCTVWDLESRELSVGPGGLGLRSGVRVVCPESGVWVEVWGIRSGEWVSGLD